MCMMRRNILSRNILLARRAIELLVYCSTALAETGQDDGVNLVRVAFDAAPHDVVKRECSRCVVVATA